jgi:uncharacterized membrane protein YphA (DoxX/SURF4 family)
VIGVATAGAWLLAGLLAWTGAAKLRQHVRTADRFAALGLPAPRVLALAVPGAELVVAAGLVVAPSVGGVAALVLLAAFTAFLAGQLRRGGTVDCGCFGTARQDPLTSAVLVRNAVLAAAAAGALVPGAGGVPPLAAWIAASTVALLGALAVALWDLRARTGRLWDNRLPTGPEGLA